MKLWIYAIVLTFASASAGLFGQTGRVMLVLDGSNSMWGRIDGTEKIVVAREVMSQVLSELPDDMQVGLAAYGHRQKESCEDIEVLLPVGNHSRTELEAAITSVQPKGKTPITAALQLVAEGLDAPTQLILVSDGKETCEGDPCELVRNLRERGVDVTVHVVGFDVTPEEGEQLNCIAEAGGGLYANAGTADELTAALTDIRETVIEEVAAPAEVKRTAAVAIDRSKAGWRLESEGKVYEGRLFRFFTLKGDPMIQLINRDAVNVGLAIGGEMTGDRIVTYAMFVEGRGPVCERVGPEDSFQITFEPSEEGWLTGSFSGMLACPEYRAMPVEGSFHIKGPRTETEVK
ncbi:MAG: VWA domain-containing protein [Acidobacteriota bacterium]|nr:MAG: VWA domain-containing protein [Acidobacteriota bacterium]